MEYVVKHFGIDSKIELSQELVANACNGKQDYRMEGEYFGGAEFKGPRATQEDRMIAHRFSDLQTSAYIGRDEAEHEALIKETFSALTKKASKKAVPDGSTAISAWIDPKSKTVWSASLGDSEVFAVVLDKEGATKTVASLNEMHNPNEAHEIARITSLAASQDKKFETLVKNGRLNGMLAVSRAFGDHRFEEFGLLHTPSIKKHEFNYLEEGDRLFVIVACDGLTEYNPKFGLECLSKEDIGNVIAKHRDKKFGKLAELLVTAANARGSRDNISAQVTELTHACVKEANPFMLSVFDGHGGQKTAQLLQEKFTKAYLKCLAKFEPAILGEPPFIKEELSATPIIDWDALDGVSTEELPEPVVPDEAAREKQAEQELEAADEKQVEQRAEGKEDIRLSSPVLVAAFEARQQSVTPVKPRPKSTLKRTHRM